MRGAGYYTDPDSGAVIEYTHEPEDNPYPDGPTLEVNQKVADAEEAKELARTSLNEKNKNADKASFTLVGDVGMVAGVTVKVVGWGIFDGKYIVETATHKTTGGYTVALTLRKTKT